MTLSEKVYIGIRNDIFNSKYNANEFLIEQELAAKYNVSKGTVSEALHRLCMDGHLKSYPRKGYLIAVLSADEFKQIQRMRVAVESLCLELLIDEAKDEDILTIYPYLDEMPPSDSEYTTINSRFHMELAKLTHDKYIIDTMRNLIGACARTEIYAQQAFMYSTQDYHKGILDAIMERNKELAKANLRNDLIKS